MVGAKPAQAELGWGALESEGKRVVRASGTASYRDAGPSQTSDGVVEVLTFAVVKQLDAMPDDVPLKMCSRTVVETVEVVARKLQVEVVAVSIIK